ncbi:MAG: helix-turn-helix domain-containing protein [Bacteriovoracaceae bacterium]|nr:helix-turn-helix domain-containing protein [Bacteriovoracaceae bacterium]
MKIENEIDYKRSPKSYNKDGSDKNLIRSDVIFDNLIWLTTREASVYLRRSVNAVHTLVSRGQLKARKFSNRLYFKKEELDYMIETSHLRGG